MAVAHVSPLLQDPALFPRSRSVQCSRLSYRGQRNIINYHCLLQPRQCSATCQLQLGLGAPRGTKVEGDWGKSKQNNNNKKSTHLFPPSQGSSDCANCEDAAVQFL